MPKNGPLAKNIDNGIAWFQFALKIYFTWKVETSGKILFFQNHYKHISLRVPNTFPFCSFAVHTRTAHCMVPIVTRPLPSQLVGTCCTLWRQGRARWLACHKMITNLNGPSVYSSHSCKQVFHTTVILHLWLLLKVYLALYYLKCVGKV